MPVFSTGADYGPRIGRSQALAVKAGRSGLTVAVSGFVVIVVSALVFAASAYAASGDLDPTFAGDGTLVSDVGGAPEAGLGGALQSDGKVVSVGKRGSEMAIERYTVDGRLDSSFSGDGRVTVGFADTNVAFALDVAIQADGRILVAGNHNGVGVVLARFLPDGTLDSSFDGDGKLLTGLNEAFDVGVAVAPDGKVILLTDTGCCAPRDLEVSRYSPTGQLDRDFSEGGRQKIDFGTGSDQAGDLLLDPDGRIVVAGNNGSGLSTSLPQSQAAPDQAASEALRAL